MTSRYDKTGKRQTKTRRERTHFLVSISRKDCESNPSIYIYPIHHEAVFIVDGILGAASREPDGVTRLLEERGVHGEQK